MFTIVFKLIAKQKMHKMGAQLSLIAATIEQPDRQIEMHVIRQIYRFSTWIGRFCMVAGHIL